MAKRQIITMNTGSSWIPDNVVESHQNAARRWGCEYVQIDCSSKDWFGDKHRYLASVSHDVEQAMWLDGDCIVRFDCPNVFGLCEPGWFYGVPNFQGDTHGGDPAKYHEYSVDYINRTIGTTVPYNQDTYVNGGVFVFSPADHSGVFRMVVDELACLGRMSPVNEQTTLNIALVVLKVKRGLLAPTFNKLGRKAWREGPMRYAIQHLANYNWGDECSPRLDKRDRLRAIDWGDERSPRLDKRDRFRAIDWGEKA